MAYIADTLGMGDKFWVLGYSGGGPHAWAALHYIPNRLAGTPPFHFSSSSPQNELGTFCVLLSSVFTNLSGPKLVPCLQWTPIFECCVVSCGSKNGHQKDIRV